MTKAAASNASVFGRTATFARLLSNTGVCLLKSEPQGQLQDAYATVLRTLHYDPMDRSSPSGVYHSCYSNLATLFDGLRVLKLHI